MSYLVDCAYLGNFEAGDTINWAFTTRQSTGVPFTLAGSPVVSIYKDGSISQSISGVTLTVDYDSIVGLNHLSIATDSDDVFYSNASTFIAVITAGTINGVSVVGEVLGRFTLRNQIVGSTVFGSDGAYTYTYTVYKDDSLTPLPACEVWVSVIGTDSQRTASKNTDDLGNVSFNLNAGTYNIWRKHGSFIFDNPQEIEVSP